MISTYIDIESSIGIRLQWDHTLSVYTSQFYDLQDGTHDCSLVIGGKRMRLCPVTVIPGTIKIEIDYYPKTDNPSGGDTNVDSLQHEVDEVMSSPSLQRSTQYEELLRKQLSFTEGLDNTENNNKGSRDGLFDEPMTDDRQQDMRDVQNALERLDSKHGVLQRHASAELVRPSSTTNDYLKRTNSGTFPSSKKPEVGGAVATSASYKAQGKESGRRDSSGSAPQIGYVQPGSSSVTHPGASHSIVMGDHQSQTYSEGKSRIPLRSPLTTTRTVPMTSSPKHIEAVKPVRAHSSDHQMRDMDSPEKTPSLRQLLAESKSETADLRRRIDDLNSENRRLRNEKYTSSTNGHSSDNSLTNGTRTSDEERRYNQLLREKENMATELWKLRQQVEDLAQGTKSEVGSELGEAEARRDKIESYRADNPDVLQRKIEDLQSQIQDLQEANETASAEVLRLDQENQVLTAELNKCRNSTEFDAERRYLHQQLNDLMDARDSQEDRLRQDEVLHMKSDMAQMSIDLKAMQEKTRILQEENLKLRETLRDYKQGDRWKGSGSSVNDTETRRHEKEAARDEIENLRQKIHEMSARSHTLPQIRQPERRMQQNGTASVGFRSAYDRDRLAFDPYSPSYQPTRDYPSYTTHEPITDSFSSQRSNALTGDSGDRAPSPSAMSESTTVLLASYGAYRPSGSRTYTEPTLNPPVRQPTTLPVRIEQDAMSECTMDIINEASFNTQAFDAYDVNDSASPPTGGYTSSVRRGSVGSSSVHSESTQERLAPPPTYGLRSVLSPILPTQHNKANLSPPRLSLNTAGRRPFAPRSPGDLNMGDVAKFTRPDGRIGRGAIKFIGHLHDKNDTFVGLELEYQEGKHDGMYDGVRYFDCKPNRGAFVTFNKIIMVWGS